MKTNRTLCRVASVAGLALLAFQAPGFAQVPSYGPSITLEQARKIASGAAAEARKNSWPVAIAVVDPHGALVYYERMDDTQSASPVIAVDKARTAAMFRRPTRVLEDGVNKGRPSVLGLPGATPITGGLPIMIGGKVAGGVGVSGVTSDQDEQIAKAGLDGMK
jgi:uncharacterized protein GlcG (DUF336 family)